MKAQKAEDLYGELIGSDPVVQAKKVFARKPSGARRGGEPAPPRRSPKTPYTLTRGQSTFVNELAQLSGMNKDVLIAWIVAEEGFGTSSSAQSREMDSNFNWLNVAYYDSGAGALTRNVVWSNPSTAAQAVNDFLRGKKFGPSEGIKAIIKTASKSAEQQIAAIAGSGWASSGYENGDTLRTLYNQISGANLQLTGATTAGGDAGAVTGGIDAEGMQTIGTAAAFAVTMEGPSNEERKEAIQLTGDKSYLNDKPLIEFIKQLTQACMHDFQSLPDGRFYAFFPDYFGSWNHREPYWSIDDVEVIDATIYLSDENLFTHVYVVGDTMESGTSPGGLGPGFINRLNSNGVVSIFDAFNQNWIDGSSSKVFSSPEKFMERYGVRPHYEDAAYVHSPFFEMFVSFQKFMFLWSRQFLSKCEFTFMPEIYPGGRIEFKDRGFVCYVDSVSHSFDYENGFTTTANLSAPASSNNTKGYADGMIRPSTGGSL